MTNRDKPIPTKPNIYKRIDDDVIIQKVEIKLAYNEKLGLTELEKFVTHQNIDKNKDVNGKQ